MADEKTVTRKRLIWGIVLMVVVGGVYFAQSLWPDRYLDAATSGLTALAIVGLTIVTLFLVAGALEQNKLTREALVDGKAGLDLARADSERQAEEARRTVEEARRTVEEARESRLEAVRSRYDQQAPMLSIRLNLGPNPVRVRQDEAVVLLRDWANDWITNVNYIPPNLVIEVGWVFDVHNHGATPAMLSLTNPPIGEYVPRRDPLLGPLIIDPGEDKKLYWHYRISGNQAYMYVQQGNWNLGETPAPDLLRFVWTSNDLNTTTFDTHRLDIAFWPFERDGAGAHWRLKDTPLINTGGVAINERTYPPLRGDSPDA